MMGINDFDFLDVTDATTDLILLDLVDHYQTVFPEHTPLNLFVYAKNSLCGIFEYYDGMLPPGYHAVAAIFNDAEYHSIDRDWYASVNICIEKLMPSAIHDNTKTDYNENLFKDNPASQVELFQYSRELWEKYGSRLDVTNHNQMDYRSLSMTLLWPNEESDEAKIDEVWRTSMSVTLQAIGVKLLENSLYSESKLFLINSIQFQPKNHHAYQHLGDISRKQKGYADAINYYQRAVAIRLKIGKVRGIDVDSKDSDLAEYYYLISLSHKELNEFESANKYLIKSQSHYTGNNYFGYMYDGFSTLEDFEGELQQKREDFQKKKNPTNEDYLSIIGSIEFNINSVYRNFKWEINKIRDQTFFEKLDSSSKEFLESAEMLYHLFPKEADFSPSIIQYSKVVESELHKKLVPKFHAIVVAEKIHLSTISNRKSHNDDLGKLTLGGITHLLRDATLKDAVRNNMSQQAEFILNILPEKLNNIIDLRNSCAHIHGATQIQAKGFRAIVLNDLAELLGSI